MREIFPFFALFFALQACQTVQLKSMIYDDYLCKNPDRAWDDYGRRWTNEIDSIKKEMDQFYTADLSSMSLEDLQTWDRELGLTLNPMAYGKLPERVRTAASYLIKMNNCINPEAKEMADRYSMFMSSLNQAIVSAREIETARRKEMLAKSAEEERQREAKEAEDYKKACDTEKRYAKQHGLKPTCGTSVSELVYALVQNHAKESEVKKSIVYIGNSDWTDEQSIQALPDMALFSVDSGRFTLMIKAKGLIQGQTLNDVGKMLVFEGITNYQANFGPRQAFVFSILNPR